MVPARPEGPGGQSLAQLLRVERHPGPVPGRPHHLQRLRGLQLVVGSGGRSVLLAPVLLAPAGPELRQRRGAPGAGVTGGPLAADRGRRAAPGRRALPLRAPGDELREPARDPRLPARPAPARGRALPGPPAAGRGQPVARGRRRVLRGRRRVPHGLPLPPDAPALHGDPDGGSLPDHRHPPADPGDPGRLPVGALPAQPRRAHARDGDRRGARLHVPDVRPRAGGPDQPGDPPAPRAAPGQRPEQDRADERAPAVAAGNAGHLLRRRDRDGRQHLPRRPRRRAHPDAVERRPQRRLLAGQPAAPLPAADHRPRVPLRDRQRRDPGEQLGVAAVVDAPHAGPAQALRGLRARRAGVPPPGEPARAGLPAARRRALRADRGQPVALPPVRGARPVAVPRLGPG